jgi:3-oxoacyl-[acyl-carrier-protein] synthase III
LLLFAGVTRSGYVTEPAIATLIAGEMKINDTVDAAAPRKTLAFDVYNATVGFLQACEVASRMIQAGPYQTAMVVTSEQEINAESYPEVSLGMYETASAVIMRASDNAQRGFGDFVFHYVTDHLTARTIYGGYHDGKPLARLSELPNIDQLYIAAIPAAVDELLQREGLDRSQISVILPPQRGKAFNDRLAEVLGMLRSMVVDVPLPDESLDLTTSTLPYSFEQALQSGRAKPGDIGRVINVASGLQVGTATDYF